MPIAVTPPIEVAARAYLAVPITEPAELRRAHAKLMSLMADGFTWERVELEVFMPLLKREGLAVLDRTREMAVAWRTAELKRLVTDLWIKSRAV